MFKISSAKNWRTICLYADTWRRMSTRHRPYIGLHFTFHVYPPPPMSTCRCPQPLRNVRSLRNAFDGLHRPWRRRRRPWRRRRRGTGPAAARAAGTGGEVRVTANTTLVQELSVPPISQIAAVCRAKISLV